MVKSMINLFLYGAETREHYNKRFFYKTLPFTVVKETATPLFKLGIALERTQKLTISLKLTN